MPTSISSFHLELSSSYISGICDRTVDRSFCLRFMNSTAGIRAANFIGAGKITLTVSDQKARETQKYIRALVLGRKTTDPKVKQSYKTCLEKYGDAIRSISVAKDSFVTGDYDTGFTSTTVAQRDADACNHEVTAGPARGGVLGERNKYLSNLLDIVLVILNLVGG
ncbi:unnamed protein product [Linum trigynum]